MSGNMKRRYATVPGLQLAIEEGTSSGPSPAKEPRLSESGGPVIQELQEQDSTNLTGQEFQDILNYSDVTVTTPDAQTKDQPPLRKMQPVLKKEVQDDSRPSSS